MRGFCYVLLTCGLALAQQKGASYGTLKRDQVISGFQTVSVYLDDAGRAFGARFHHQWTGFTLDLLQIQSAPQAMTCVPAYANSNMGEAHTIEHLLLRAGAKGRALAELTQMNLGNLSGNSGFTKVCYAFHTAAGIAAFFPYYRSVLDALLHPDYTDEEIRREAWHFDTNESAGALHLEEQGSVYNEMVSSDDDAGGRINVAATEASYGQGHPLAFFPFGLPAAMRAIQPPDIRRFHASHYFMANMTSVVAVPKEVTLSAALTQLGSTLNKVGGPAGLNQKVMTEESFPSPRPMAATQVLRVDYPSESDQQPSDAILQWPADRKLTVRDKILLQLFLSNIAGQPDTNLYKRLIDSKTREIETGARGVVAVVQDGQGYPVRVRFLDLPVARLTDFNLGDLRARVMDELSKIATYPDGSPELAQFQQRLKGRIVQRRRLLVNLVNSPPGFGERGGGTEWIDRLDDLNREEGFYKSVTLKEDLSGIERSMSGPANVWRDLLKQWKISGVTPLIIAGRPVPALFRQARQEREERAAAEIARLKKKYGLIDDQAALARYRTEYDAVSATMEAAAKTAVHPRFVDRPPMSLDKTLDYEATTLPGGVAMVRSKFENMTGATTGLALRLDGVPRDRVIYLSMLPQLLTAAGVIDSGRALSFDEMTQRLRNDILRLNADFTSNPATGRTEIVVRGAGSNTAESKRAIEWMKLVLFHPNWQMQNIARMRDLVDSTLAGLRRTMQQPEELWVDNVGEAYWKQDDPAYLAAASFLTRAHNVHRLHWMLKDAASPAVIGFLTALGRQQGAREHRRQVLASIRDGSYSGLEQLSAKEKDVAMDTARELETMLADIPDTSLAADWTYLCNQMAQDIQQGPERTLAILDELRRSILTTGGARMFWIGSGASRAEMDTGIREVVGLLDPKPFQRASYGTTMLVKQRLSGREPGTANPLFVGLLRPNSQSGVVMNSAPLAGFADASREKVLDYLSVRLYGGAGPRSVSAKTAGAGLAYSNGIGTNPWWGRMEYYAERTPELPRTLQFAAGIIRDAQPDPVLVNYAVSGAFFGSRVANTYESRGEQMAAELADGLTPEKVARFRQAALDVAKTPQLHRELTRRMKEVDAKILPGLGVKAKDVQGGIYFVIGPEKQISAYEQYLKRTDDPDDQVWRLYARDFWQVGDR